MEDKDLQRLKDIKTKAKGDRWKEQTLAEVMAAKITGKIKAFGRYEASCVVFGDDNRVTKIFLDRAKELGHEEAIGDSAMYALC